MPPLRRLPSLLAIIAGKLVSVGSLFLCGVLVARATNAAEFGVYSATLTLVLLLDSCLGAPLDYASVRFAALHENDAERVARLQGAVFRLKMGMGCVLLLAALGFGRDVARWVLHDAARPAVIWLACGSTVALLFVRGVAAFLQSQRRFGAYAILDFAHGACRVAAMAALAFLGVEHAEGYIGGFGAALLLLSLCCCLFLRQPYLWAGRPAPGDAGALRRFIGLIAGVIVLGSITGRADILFLSAHRDAAEVGRYAGAAQLAGSLTLIATYASVVVQPTLIQGLKDGRLAKFLFENSAVALLLAGIAIAAVLSFGGDLLAILFGEGYRVARPLLSILVIGTSLDLLFMPVAMTFALQFKPRTALLGELVITAVFLALAGPFAVRGAVAMCWLVTGVRCAKAVLYLGMAGRQLRKPPASILQETLPAGLG